MAVAPYHLAHEGASAGTRPLARLTQEIHLQWHDRVRLVLRMTSTKLGARHFERRRSLEKEVLEMNTALRANVRETATLDPSGAGQRTSD
jgi:hypothetical protein